jgi:beta-phosphoglucomutase-like phosphatase (HAD superfamily)
MIIGVDLDETLIDSSVIWKRAFKEFDMESSYKPPQAWSFPNYPDKVRKRIFELFEDPMAMTTIPLFAGARSKLMELKLLGHRIIVITSRYAYIPTQEFIKTNFPAVDKVIISGFTESKKKYFIDECLDLWIDDAPHGIKDAMSMGIKTILISNLDTPYNHHMRNIGFGWVDSFSELDVEILNG